MAKKYHPSLINPASISGWYTAGNTFRAIGSLKDAVAAYEAAHKLAQARPDVPIIGSLTGPISTAASIVDPMQFFKELYKNKEQSHRTLDYVSDFLIAACSALRPAT